MTTYALSLGAGLLVGLIYSLLEIRSPAPPVVALVGLLGMLLGEQIIPVGRHLIAGSAWVSACRQAGSGQHLFGPLPGRHDASAPKTTSEEPSGSETRS